MFSQDASSSQVDIGLNPKTVTADSITLESKPHKSFDIGFFETFEDFRDNIAITDLPIEIQKRTTETKLHLKNPQTRKKIKHFAYYNGNDIYINATLYSLERHYVKAEWINEYLMLNDVFENSNTVDDMSLAFGMLGVLASNQEQYVFLNMDSGEYYYITRKKLIRLIKEVDRDLYKQNRRQIKKPDVLKGILHELNKRLGKEDFSTMLFG